MPTQRRNLLSMNIQKENECHNMKDGVDIQVSHAPVGYTVSMREEPPIKIIAFIQPNHVVVI